MGAALEQAAGKIMENAAKVSPMRDRLIEGLLKIPCAHLSGDRRTAFPG
jgi:cysteine desulfurase